MQEDFEKYYEANFPQCENNSDMADPMTIEYLKYEVVLPAYKQGYKDAKKEAKTVENKTSNPETHRLKQLHHAIDFFLSRGKFRIANEIINEFNIDSSVSELRMILVAAKPFKESPLISDNLKRILDVLESKIGKIN